MSHLQQNAIVAPQRERRANLSQQSCSSSQSTLGDMCYIPSVRKKSSKNQQTTNLYLLGQGLHDVTAGCYCGPFAEQQPASQKVAFFVLTNKLPADG